MVTHTFSSTVHGVEARLVTIEVNIVSGTQMLIVGLPDNAVKESQHRIESVLKHLGWSVPRKRVIVNLAPASMRKEGAAYDLPIALAILHASGQVHFPDLSSYLVVGELALDGQLRPVRGVLPMALAARSQGIRRFLLPEANGPEAALVKKVEVLPAPHFQAAVEHLSGRGRLAPLQLDLEKLFSDSSPDFALDIQEVQGQGQARRALEIAAAGGHNLLMIGPPGSGKSMLAKRLPSVLPPLSLEEALETTKVYSVAGKLAPGAALVATRPFRTPHHTTSEVALVGGGSMILPGEISLANHGVLALEELPEFRRSVIEVLRQPLEDGEVTITRARGCCTFPAHFTLVATMNPCPCGYYTHPEKVCHCTPLLRRKYLGKISGPLLDRIDLHVEVQPVRFDLLHGRSGEGSAAVRRRVIACRQIQQDRLKGVPHVYTNAQMPASLMRRFCTLTRQGQSMLSAAMEKLGLSARAHDRILKVARTVADLAGSDTIQEEHLAEAIHYRSLDREGWAG